MRYVLFKNFVSYSIERNAFPGQYTRAIAYRGILFYI